FGQALARAELGSGVLAERLPEAREAGEHAALDRPERLSESLGELGLRVAAVVSELDRLPLLGRKPAQRLADRLPLGGYLGLVGGLGARRLGVGQRLRAAPLLSADEVYRPAVNEGEQPGARLRALGDEAVGCAPRAEEGLLHGVLRQGVVAENAEGEPVGE